MVVLFPLISFPYISRVLGVEGIGKFQYCTSVLELIRTRFEKQQKSGEIGRNSQSL